MRLREEIKALKNVAKQEATEKQKL